jgi:hypothetical protein
MEFIENLCALEWGIRLDEWWMDMSREWRVKSVATVMSRNYLQNRRSDPDKVDVDG